MTRLLRLTLVLSVIFALDFFDAADTCLRERRPKAALGYSTLLGRALFMRVFPVDSGMVMLANDASESILQQFQLAKKALEDALTGLALVYSDLGDTKQAAELLQRAAALRPSLTSLESLANAYEQSRDFDKAASAADVYDAVSAAAARRPTKEFDFAVTLQSLRAARPKAN